VGIQEIRRVHGGDLPNGEKAMPNRRRTRRVLDPAVATQVASILQTVVSSGTATRAQVADVNIAGKTGTTEGYGDAWFVGWTPRYTVAVWVGYPDRFTSMETEFNGEPVAGGTFPAGIFKTFVETAYRLRPEKEDEEPVPTDGTPVAPTPGTTAPTAPSPAPTGAAPTGGTGDGDGGDAPAPEEAPAPAPEEAPPPASEAPGTGGAAPAPEG
jgi:penicillin-binding protein 1A